MLNHDPERRPPSPSPQGAHSPQGPAPGGQVALVPARPGRGENPALASCSSLISRPTRRSPAPSSSDWSIATGPGTYSSTCRPSTSRPSGRGAPVKPPRHRCESSASTAGVQYPAGLRTVSPTRTTPAATFPPPSGCSVMIRARRDRLARAVAAVIAGAAVDELAFELPHDGVAVPVEAGGQAGLLITRVRNPCHDPILPQRATWTPGWAGTPRAPRRPGRRGRR